MVWLLTRKDNAQSIRLPEDLRWVDEYDWQAVAQTAPVYSLGGSVLVQQARKLAGRPITLTGNWVWVPKSTVDTLWSWTDTLGLKMTLTHYDGRTFDVGFRLHQQAMSVEPIHYCTPEAASDPYTLTLNLMTV